SEDPGKTSAFFASFRFVLCGHTVLDDATIKQVYCAIRVLSETLIVRDHANRGATLMQLAEQMHDRFAVVRIEVTGRLVCEQNRWPPGQRARNCDTLLLTAGELTRQVFCPMRHAYALQRFRHQCFAVAGAGAAIREW